MTDDEFYEWFNVGIDHGWISEPVCATHEGLPSTASEAQEWEDGFDPCQAAVRVWALQEEIEN
jgi:hypothetical protein